MKKLLFFLLCANSGLAMEIESRNTYGEVIFHTSNHQEIPVIESSRQFFPSSKKPVLTTASSKTLLNLLFFLNATQQAVDLLPPVIEKEKRITQWKKAYKKLENNLPTDIGELEELQNAIQDTHCSHPIVSFFLEKKLKQERSNLSSGPSWKNFKKNVWGEESTNQEKALDTISEDRLKKLALDVAEQFNVIVPYNAKTQEIFNCGNMFTSEFFGNWVHCDGSKTDIRAIVLASETNSNLHIIHLLPVSEDLTYLDLSKNNLRELPKQITELSNLEILRLVNNKLSSVPSELTRLKHLTTLVLFNNNFSTLPVAITYLPKLNLFSIGKNKLTTLPSEITQLTNLKEILLCSNNFSSIPPLPTNLQVLDIESNDLTDLDSLTQLTKLKALNASKNYITKIPNDLSNLPLTYINLEKNPLPEIPKELSALTGLKTLLLANNPIEQLPCDILRISILSTLSIQDSKLTISRKKTQNE